MDMRQLLYKGFLFSTAALLIIITLSPLTTGRSDYVLPAYTIIGNLFLGTIVFFKNPKSKINWSFSAMVFFIAFWTLSNYLSDHSALYSWALIWNKMIYTVTSFMMIYIAYFALFFPEDRSPLSVQGKSVLFLPGVVIGALALFTGLMVKDIYFVSTGTAIVYGPLFIFHSIFVVLYLVFALSKLAIKYFKGQKIHRVQLGYVFLGIFLSGFLAVITNVLLPMFANFRFTGLGPVFSLFFVGFTTYSITKHRLMDISVIISRAVAEILTVLFLGSIYLSLVGFYRTYVSTRIDLIFLVWTVVYGIMVGQVHQRIRLFIQTTSDKLFLRGKYDYYRELSDASTRVGEKLSLPSILGILYETFYNVVEISKPRIFLPEYFTRPETASERYLVYEKEAYLPESDGEEVRFDDPLVKQLISTRAPIHNLHNPERELIVPCLLEDRLIGIFVLGRKLSEDPYTDDDIRLLEVLASQAAVALDHTRSYEKIRADLEIAERQLARSQRLASLGTLTAGVTHEIRNPLTVIRSETERLANAVRDLEYLKKHRDLLLKHIDRIASIVQRMLSLAKEKPKQESELDLNELIKATLQLFTVSRITLKKDLREVPKIKGDPQEIEEVFVNLIQNAIEAMPEGGTLTLRTYPEDSRTVAEVSDTGRGIPEGIRERIFDPFFSTRHEGVGLGLSIAYRIIREHGGDIKVSSEAGRGTTFKILF